MVRKYSFNLCVHLPLHIESGNIAVSDIQNPSWNFFLLLLTVILYLMRYRGTKPGLQEKGQRNNGNKGFESYQYH